MLFFHFFLHGPFNSRTKLKFSKDHSIHGSKSHYLHGPFHSRTNVKLYPKTIPFTDHSIHGPIIFRLTSHTANMPINLSRTIPYTDHSIRPLLFLYGPITYRLMSHIPLTCSSNANNHGLDLILGSVWTIRVYKTINKSQKKNSLLVRESVTDQCFVMGKNTHTIRITFANH